jgi:hypothetical protein
MGFVRKRAVESRRSPAWALTKVAIRGGTWAVLAHRSATKKMEIIRQES